MRISKSKLDGVVDSSPSKSYTHRALIIGALSGHRFTVHKLLESDDTAATLAALSMMGAAIEKKHDSISLRCPELSPPVDTVNVWNSGTTLRFITGVAALLDSNVTITGDASIRKRPIKPLLDALRTLGATCSGTGTDEFPPIDIKGPMTGMQTSLPGDVSSQFISSLLISCPMKDSETEINIRGEQKSKPYIEATLHILNRLGIEIERKTSGFWIPGGQRPSGSEFRVPGDFSSASFPLIGAAITEGNVTIRGLDPSIPQADSLILKALEDFGASVEMKGEEINCIEGESRSFEFDVGQSPDLFPILGILAATAKGESRLFGGEHLRFKESDRISTTVAMLHDLGVDAEERDDGCVIRGTGRIRGGVIETKEDHRIMMSAVVAGLVSEKDVLLDDTDSFHVSYPRFIEDMRSLGAAIEEVSE